MLDNKDVFTQGTGSPGTGQMYQLTYHMKQESVRTGKAWGLSDYFRAYFHLALENETSALRTVSPLFRVGLLPQLT